MGPCVRRGRRGERGASWFEAALARLLTTRIGPCAAYLDLILRSRAAASRRTGRDKKDDTTPRSRGTKCPSFAVDPPSSETRGRREGRVPFAPMVRVQKKARGRTTGTSRTTGLPCAMVLRLIRDLPGDRALLPPSPRIIREDLAPALGRQDHTISPSAPCCSSHNTLRPSHPASYVRDDRDTPLLWVRDAREHGFDLPDGAIEKFASPWHDGQFAHDAHAPVLKTGSTEIPDAATCRTANSPAPVQ
jgi:hypothetical protein